MPPSESWHAILVAVTASGLDVGALKAHAISQRWVTALDVNAVVASVEPASPLGAELTAAKAVRSTCQHLLQAGAPSNAQSGQRPIWTSAALQAGAADAPLELKVKAVQAQLPGFKDAALAAEGTRRSKAAEDAAAALQVCC